MNESSKANEQADNESAQSVSGEPSANNPDPTVAGVDYEFAEPELGAAAISEDVAERVDLEAAEAEAARVGQEAKLAAQGLSTPMGHEIPAPDFKSPDFQAPAIPAPAVAEPESAASTGSESDPDSSAEDNVDWDSASTVLRTDFSKPPIASNPWSKQAGQGHQDEPATSPEQANPVQANPVQQAAPVRQSEPEPTPGGPVETPEQPATPVAPLPQEAQPQFPAQPPAMPAPQSASPAAADSTDPAETTGPSGTEGGTAATAGAGAAAAHNAPAPHIGAGIDDGHGWRRPETPWQQSGTPWQPKANAWQSPSQLARGEEEAAARSAAAASGSAAGGPPDAGAPSEFGSPQDQQAPAAGQPPYGAQPQPGPQPYGGAPQAGAPGVPPVPGYPGGPQGPGYGGPGGPQGPGSSSGSNKKKLFIVLGVVVVGLGLIALFVWLLVSLFSSGIAKVASPVSVETSQLADPQSTPASPGVDAADPDADVILPAVSPLKWLEGDCLRDFKDVSTDADVVFCNSPHNAELVGVYYYGEDEKFPGAEALKARAVKVCDSVEFTSDASGIKTLKQSTAYPSEASWNTNDDRRVDCMVSDTRDGNLLESSIIK